MSYAGRNVLVLGLAREGVSLARALTAEGARVTVTDAAAADKLGTRLASLEGADVRVVVGGHHPELVAGTDFFFVSPGVPEDNPVYQAARLEHLPIESMTTLFFDRCPGRIIGVTGSSGKTTTTGLIGHILHAAGRDVVVGGNIGAPMLDLLPDIGPHTDVVLELSSFQLALMRRSPQIAVVTNISPNHLDRHGTMEAYINAKANIVRYQRPEDVAILNADDPTSATFATQAAARVTYFGSALIRDDGVYLHDGRFVLPIDDIPLLGRHNVENVSAAVVAAAHVGIEPETTAEAVRTFRPAPHRLEIIGERQGVRYIDDSIATSPARAAVALQSIDAPILLIAGGRDKRLPWDDFARLASQRVKALFLIGEAADLIEAALRRESGSVPIYRMSSLQRAVTAAGRAAEPGDVVLLSPGCTSYDMFENFEERGAMFARCVEELRAA